MATLTTPPVADVAVFTSSPKSLRVSKTGFTYAFVATPGRSGKLKLTSTKSIKVGSKTSKLKLASRSFATPANGKVTLRYKLSAKYLKELKRVTSLTFKASVTVGSKKLSAKLKLKPPKKRGFRVAQQAREQSVHHLSAPGPSSQLRRLNRD